MSSFLFFSLKGKSENAVCGRTLYWTTHTQKILTCFKYYKTKKFKMMLQEEDRAKGIFIYYSTVFVTYGKQKCALSDKQAQEALTQH